MQPGVEAWLDDTTPDFKGIYALASMSSLVHWASTLPLPVFPMSDVPASDTLVRLPTLMLTIGPKHMKCNCSPDSAPND